MTSTTVAVTGGLGFIGSRLVEKLCARGDIARVLVLDRGLGWKYSRRWSTVPPKVEIVTVDIAQAPLVDAHLARCSTVFHLAAETHVENSIWNPEPALQTNVIGTFRVLEAARKHGVRLVLASSSEVYGAGDGGRLTLDSPLQPRSPYAATKVAAESLATAYVHTYGLDAAIVRMFNVYGPGQYYEKLVPMLICSALCGLDMPVQGSGHSVRDWSFVDDTCDRLLLAAYERGALVRNLGSGVFKSVQEIAHHVASIAGLPLRIERFPERAGNVSTQIAGDHHGVARTASEFEVQLRLTFDWYAAKIGSWRHDFLLDRERIVSRFAREGQEIAVG